MSEVWVIVQLEHTTYGNGDGMDRLRIAMLGPRGLGGPHPAFTTEQLAREYIKSLSCGVRFDVLRINVQQ